MSERKTKETWKDRRINRIREENKVVIVWAKHKDPKRNNMIYAFTQDLSIDGAKILTDINFPVDTIFDITLTLSRSMQIITLAAHVRWVKPVYDEDLFHVGLEFIHERPQTISSLIRHLYGKDLPQDKSL